MKYYARTRGKNITILGVQTNLARYEFNFDSNTYIGESLVSACSSYKESYNGYLIKESEFQNLILKNMKRIKNEIVRDQIKRLLKDQEPYLIEKYEDLW